MKEVAVGVVVGAALESSVGRTFAEVQHKLSQVQSLAEKIKVGKALAEDLRAKYREFTRLKTAVERTGGVTKELREKLGAARRAFLEAQVAARKFGISLRDAKEKAEEFEKALDALERKEKALGRIKLRQEIRADIKGKALDTIALGATVAAPLWVAADFEQAMAEVKAITGATGEDFKKLTKLAREMGAKTIYSASQAAEAMKYLGMAGFNTEQILKSLPSVLALAQAGNMDLARTADIASNILSGFKLKAEEMGRVADVLAQTARTANVDVSMLGETMKYVAPIASQVGASLEETAALAGLLGNVGIQGSQAGTTLRAMLLRLSAPTGEAAKALKELGVETTDAEGNMRNLLDILADLAEATKDMGSAEKLEVLKKIFGEEPAAGVMELLSQAGAGGIRKYLQVVKESAGAAKEMQKIMGDTARGALLQFKSAIESLQISVAQGLLPVVKGIALFASKLAMGISFLAEKFPRLTTAITGAVAGFIALSVVRLTTRYFSTFIGDAIDAAKILKANLSPALVKARLEAIRLGIASAKTKFLGFVSSAREAAISAVRLGKSLVLAARGFFLARIEALKTAAVSTASWARETAASFFSLARGALPAVVTGLRAVAVATLTNPVFLIGAAIAGVAALVITHWGRVREFLTGFWERVKSLWQGAIGTIVGFVKEHFGSLGAIVRTAFSLTPIGMFVQGMKLLGSAIKKIFNIDLFASGKALIESFVQGVLSVVKKPVAVVKQIVGKIRNLLPFSPAREGPLADLGKTGPAFVRTFAEGIVASQGVLKKAVATTLAGAVLMPSAQTLAYKPVVEASEAPSVVGRVLYRAKVEEPGLSPLKGVASYQASVEAPEAPEGGFRQPIKSVSVSIGPVHIHIEGSSLSPEEIAEKVRLELERLARSSAMKSYADGGFVV